MTKRCLKIVFSCLVFALALSVSHGAYADAVATVKEIQGEVFYQPAGSAPDLWNPISQETAVNSGDSLKTGNGSCLLSYTDQADFRVEPNTTVTVQQQADTEDIHLKVGNLKAKINKEKIVRPFQVVTPTAVGAVRGTEVDFGLNENGELTVDLHNDGPVQLVNEDAAMELELLDGRKITIIYDKENGKLTVKNDCSSSGDVGFSVLGQGYSVPPCQEVTANVETTEAAAGETGVPPTDPPANEGEQVPDEGAEDTDDTLPPPPSSPV